MRLQSLPSSRSGGDDHLPMARIDRVWRGREITTGLGPMHVPPADAVVEALYLLAALGPVTRVGLRFDPETPARWIYRRPDLVDWIRSCVVQLPPGSDRDIDELLVSLPTERAHRPLQVFLADRHVFVRMDHSLGDGRLAAALPALIVSVSQGGELPRWATMPVEANPLGVALRATFSTTASVRTLMTARRADRSATLALGAGHGSTVGTVGTVHPFTPAPAAVNEEGPPGAVRTVQTWARTNAPGAAFHASVLTAVHQALAEHGVACAPGVHMLYDLRRYLPRGRHILSNFAFGIDLPVLVGDPLDLTAVTERVVRSGRPLAALAAATARPRTAAELPRHISVPDLPLARLSYSYVGTKPLDPALPWLGGPDVRRRWTRLDPADPCAITVLALISNRRLVLSASFHATVFDPATVRAALRAVHADPVGLLGRARATTR